MHRRSLRGRLSGRRSEFSHVCGVELFSQEHPQKTEIVLSGRE
jgi:hypothetical protein